MTAAHQHEGHHLGGRSTLARPPRPYAHCIEEVQNPMPHDDGWHRGADDAVG